MWGTAVNNIDWHFAEKLLYFFDKKELFRKLIDTGATAARRIVLNTSGKHVQRLSEVDLYLCLQRWSYEQWSDRTDG